MNTLDVVATNDGLYSVGAHQADNYDLVYNGSYLLASKLPADDCGCGHRWSAYVHAQSIVTPMQNRRSTKVFSLYFTDSRKFSPSKISRYTVFNTVNTVYRRRLFNFACGWVVIIQISN